MQHRTRSIHSPSRPRGRGARRVARGVAVVLAIVLGVLAAGLATSASAATTATGWIRAGHLSPGTPEADVRLTPFDGGRPQNLGHVSFGKLSTYTRVPTGLYTVSLVRAGSPMSAAPMVSQNVRVAQGAASTVIATGTGKQVRATVLSDDLTAPPAGQSKVRLISAATTPATVDASIVAGPALANNLATGSSTGYADVKAQTWSVKLAGSNGQDSVVRRVAVKAGGVYTLVALTTPQGGLALTAVRDSVSSTAMTGSMPTGGVDTGAGGLARTGASRGGDLGLLALLLGVVGSAGAMVALRRRATA
ncbi:hypothetical protein GCM10027596_31430 [Nocardioides korecus]